MTTIDAADRPINLATRETVFAIAWRNKSVLILCGALGLVNGWYKWSRTTETYAASATIELRSNDEEIAIVSALEVQARTRTPVNEHIEAEMKSEKLIKRAIVTGGLIELAEELGQERPTVNSLRESLRVRSVNPRGHMQEVSVIVVNVQSSHPLLATASVNAFVAAYDEQLESRYKEQDNSAISYFKASSEALSGQLDTLELEYFAFRKSAPLEWDSSGDAINPFRQRAIELEAEKEALVSEDRDLKAKLKVIAETLKEKESFVQAGNELKFLIPELEQLVFLSGSASDKLDLEVELQQKLVPLRIQAQLLSDELGTDHPTRKSLLAKIEATEQALKQVGELKQQVMANGSLGKEAQEDKAKEFLKQFVSGLSRKLELLAGEIRSINERIAETREKAFQLIAFENEDLTYRKRLERLRNSLHLMESRLERADLPRSVRGLKMEVLQPAEEGQLVDNSLSFDLTSGGIVGLVVGCCFAILLDWSEKTYRSPVQLSNELNLQIISHVPLIAKHEYRRKFGKNKQDSFGILDSALCVVHDNASIAAESIRSVRTYILGSGREFPSCSVLQITSSMPGDGKSTVLSNLAILLSRTNKRVVIVDADLRRPRQATIFGVPNDKGITDVINGCVDLNDALQSTVIENLYILPAGPIPSNPSEALELPEFGEMLDDLRATFDFVLVDSPPILAVTDAVNICKNVDGVLFVMKINRRSRPNALSAVGMLKSLKVNILGVVVNALGNDKLSEIYKGNGLQGGVVAGYNYSYRYAGSMIERQYLKATIDSTVVAKGRSACIAKPIEETTGG